MRHFAILTAVILLTGCISTPSMDEKYSHSYVGDAGIRQIDPIIVAVEVRGVSEPYQNLHVHLSALINKKRFTLASNLEASDIVNRAQSRLRSEMVSEILTESPLMVANLKGLKEKLEARAQESMDSVFGQWSHADEFKVELVVSTIYLTKG